jgi:hypothetical protein
VEVRSAIQQIALEHRRRYGYRRVTTELRRRGMPVNHKRVARIMREDNLPTLAWASPQLLRTTSSVSANHSSFRRSIASNGKDPISPSGVSHWHSSWNFPDRDRVPLAWAI